MEEADPAHEPSANWKHPPVSLMPFAKVEDAEVEVALITGRFNPV